ncbi:hypothetical protein DFP91_2907 [Pseudorhodoplanes sinuspersici]|nr:hypothetical protein DFP91_2907 [Pseudorhodoplanes sinuspersici]
MIAWTQSPDFDTVCDHAYRPGNEKKYVVLVVILNDKAFARLELFEVADSNNRFSNEFVVLKKRLSQQSFDKRIAIVALKTLDHDMLQKISVVLIMPRRKLNA